MKHEERRGKLFKDESISNWWGMYWANILIAKPAHRLYRIKLVDVENVPQGACIMAGNHVSYIDPIALWAGMPQGTIHFVAKSELYHNKVLAWLLDSVGSVPVARGAADRAMIKWASDCLKGGESVAIFPEGTRGRGRDDLGGLNKGQDGAAFLSLRTGAPIVPIGIAGTDKIMPKGSKMVHFPQVILKFGKPLHPSDFEGSRKDKMAAMTTAVMKDIAWLRDGARALEKK
ncbi:MAG: 1-acyl-sn-glycerol-3-phosphate acyltransferase [Coriobacteriia bacterium]|nr:1-acyl-sn-glycerol-3-phosphate acyltransferase [Coriobacteriia bacterium]